MNKKFAFVNLSINCGYNSGMNHGLAFLTPIVRRYGYEVICLNIRKEISTLEFINRINDFDPSIVAFSCTSHQLKYLIRYSRELSKYQNILKIAGGVGPALEPKWVLMNSEVNGVCVGEGEKPLENLLNNIKNKNDYHNTEGFYWSINNSIRKNSIPQFNSDLSVLELPDYTIFDDSVVSGGTNGPSIMLSRGCPYNCYYCCNKALSSIYPSSGNYFRMLPVDKSVKLIENVVRQCPQTTFIHFEDDLLIANKNWFYDFAKEYNEKIKIPYRVCARVECITLDMVNVLKQTGCKLVFVGLESGDESFRSKFLNRKYKNEVFIEKCKLIKNAGLRLFTFNIIGFPFETDKEMENTFKLNKEVAPDRGVCTFFYPYAGTELYAICKDNKLLKESEKMREITNYNTKPAINMSFEREKRCIHYQRKILNYLLNQGELTEIRDLPFGIKKCISVIRHLVKLTLRRMPKVDKIIRGGYANFKIKAVSMVFKNSVSGETLV